MTCLAANLTADPAPLATPPRPLAKGDLAVAALMAAGSIALTLDAWRDIVRLGQKSEEQSYVFIAPLAIAWLAGVRCHQLALCQRRGGWLGVLLLALGWLLWWRGFLSDPVLWRAGAVLLCTGTVVAALGLDVLKRFLPAFGAAVFLIPISPNGRYRLALPLQDATAWAAQRLCDLLGMGVDRHGTVLSINGVDVAVAEACNGMRMVLTLLLVCYVVAFALPLRPHARILLLLCSPFVAIISNVLRLVPTVWMYGHASASAAEAVHGLAGWAMSAAAFLVLLGLLKLAGSLQLPQRSKGAA